MDNFFEKYKKLREDQKIELTDIENRTKINIKYLKNNYPSPVVPASAPLLY